MLRLYTDDSRSRRRFSQDAVDYEIHAIAGYIAPLEMWDNEFIPRWKEMLVSGFHRPVREFKAAHVGGDGYGEFKGWPQKKRTNAVIRVVDEITNERYENMFGVGAVMIYRDSPEPDAKTNTIMRDRALEAALHETIWAACMLAKSVWGPQEIHIHCDQQPGLEDRLRAVWNQLRPEVIRAYGAHISPLNFTYPSHELQPLQAADVWAWELRNDLERRLGRSDDDRMFQSLNRLLTERRQISYLIDAVDYVQRADAHQGRPVLGGMPIFHVSPDLMPASPDYPLIEDNRPTSPFLPLRHLPFLGEEP